MFRNLALLKLKHVKNMTALDSSILRCHFGMRGLCRKAVIRSQKERSHLNYNKLPKKEEKDLEFGFCFYFSNYFFYIEWTSGKQKILFICCLYTPLVFSQTAVHDTCRSANDGRATSRSCDVSWVWLSNISRVTKFTNVWVEIWRGQSEECPGVISDLSDKSSFWMNATLFFTKSMQNSTSWNRKKRNFQAKLVFFSYWYLTWWVKTDLNVSLQGSNFCPVYKRIKWYVWKTVNEEACLKSSCQLKEE